MSPKVSLPVTLQYLTEKTLFWLFDAITNYCVLPDTKVVTLIFWNDLNVNFSWCEEAQNSEAVILVSPDITSCETERG